SSEQLFLEAQGGKTEIQIIVFDPLQLEQVITNLVNNGLHHGAKLHAKPRIYFRVKTLDSGLVMLDVMDQGVGIPSNVMASLFEPFFTTESGGTGLGLYLSRAFCEANGASLWCIPQAHGACFRISFGV
ncbi:MAG: sensor histidine kinase, partial [Candidatus Saccharibacteria bacterium]|nr:sensor histidine kinase [Moraxellaceae bacterium]